MNQVHAGLQAARRVAVRLLQDQLPGHLRCVMKMLELMLELLLLMLLLLLFLVLIPGEFCARITTTATGCSTAANT